MKEDNYESGAIFCLSFGKRDTEMGLSNSFLLSKVIDFYYRHPLPVIIQEDALDRASSITVDIVKVISEHRVEGKYLDTLEVVRQCVDYCNENNYKKVFIVAHPDHLNRVVKVVKQFNLNYEIVDTSGCPYDPKSSQIWTRNRALFRSREFLINMLFKIYLKN